MRINFERTGGFMGTHLAVELLTDQMAPAEANELETLVDSSQFFDLPPVLKAPPGGADRYQYKLTVERGDQFHTVETSESATPQTLQPLIEHLTKVARSQRFF